VRQTGSLKQPIGVLQTVHVQPDNTPKVTSDPSASSSSRERGSRVAGCQLARFQQWSASAMLVGSRLSPVKAKAAAGQKATTRSGKTESRLIELVDWFRQNVKRMQSVRSVKWSGRPWPVETRAGSSASIKFTEDIPADRNHCSGCLHRLRLQCGRALV